MAQSEPHSSSLPNFDHETELIAEGEKSVAGVDEAGRGPLAGPVVAAAVVLPVDGIPVGLDDSKALSPAKREALFGQIMSIADVGIAFATVKRIDRDNILQATLWAMSQAVHKLQNPASAVLIDGNKAPKLTARTLTLVGGDRLSVSIAAASIIAKVTRDRLMVKLATGFPDFGWERNKGYGTAEHLAALAQTGPTIHHRRSFRPVREALTGR